jgi:hypothetical protein
VQNEAADIIIYGSAARRQMPRQRQLRLQKALCCRRCSSCGFGSPLKQRRLPGRGRDGPSYLDASKRAQHDIPLSCIYVWAAQTKRSHEQRNDAQGDPSRENNRDIARLVGKPARNIL